MPGLKKRKGREDLLVGSPVVVNVVTVAKAATALHAPLAKLVVGVPLPLQFVVAAKQVVVQEVVVTAVAAAQLPRSR